MTNVIFSILRGPKVASSRLKGNRGVDVFLREKPFYRYLWILHENITNILSLKSMEHNTLS